MSTAPPPGPGRRGGTALVATAIVLTGLNLRTAVTSVGPVLAEIEDGLGVSSGSAGLITSMPVLCFALIGFAGPPMAARFRDGHVLGGALLVMGIGLAVRSTAGSFALFLLGTLLAMSGGALGNVLLPGLVKRYFPDRTGLLVGAYSTALALGGAAAAVATAPVAAAVGGGGWRWSLGIWAVPAVLTAAVWLAVPARRGASRASHTQVRMRSLLGSRLTWALGAFFGLQAMQAYVIIGWSSQYLRDAGLSAGTAGLLLGLNSLVVIPLNAVVPSVVVRPHLQRPALLVFLACFAVGWTGLAAAPLTATWVWMVLLGLGTGTFAMSLTLMGLRARTPESTAALSTLVQGGGYLLAGAGPLLVGVLRGATGGYDGMFVVVGLGVVALLGTGWVVTQDRVVDDDVPELARRADDPAADRPADVEVAGAEPPVTVPHPGHPGGRAG